MISQAPKPPSRRRSTSDCLDGWGFLFDAGHTPNTGRVGRPVAGQPGVAGVTELPVAAVATCEKSHHSGEFTDLEGAVADVQVDAVDGDLVLLFVVAVGVVQHRRLHESGLFETVEPAVDGRP